jgi:Golgi nucleoside diphosphatase
MSVYGSFLILLSLDDGVSTRWDDEVLYDKRRKELQDFSRDHRLSDSEIEYGESEVRSLFHNFDISNYLFPRPGDRVGCSNLVAT